MCGSLHAADRNWATYLGDPGATHYSTLKGLTAVNVDQLRPAWTFNTGDASPANSSQIQCNPLIIDGVLYGITAQMKLFALDAATGRELWRFDPAKVSGRISATGFSRGMTWWAEGKERRILFSAGHYLYAIDPATGALFETFGENGQVDLLNGLEREARGLPLNVTTPGSIFRDLIILPIRTLEGPGPAVPGHIRAFDVRTGKQRWIFHTIPFPGEFGYETWSPDSWKTSGGANCWAGLAVDHERGLAFVPTGSATFDFWGGDRLGANLFANCLIALDAATGKRRWHFQFVHHDLGDRDLPAPPVLCEVTRDGRKIPAVAQVTKTGHVWVFNRETGESLFPWREEAVPPSRLVGEVASPTQPMPLKPAPFARQQFTEKEVTDRTPAAREAVLKRLRELEPHEPFNPPSERGTVVLPGFDGGAEWGGPAVDPNGILYVNSTEMAYTLHMVPTAIGKKGAREIFAQLCVSCHGADGKSNTAQNIPSLSNVGTRLKAADIVALLGTGRGAMPSFRFLPAQIREELAQYLIAPDAKAPVATRADNLFGAALKIPYVMTGYNPFLDPDGYPALRPPWGTLNAIDLNTGEYVWRRTLGELPELTAQGIPPTGTANYGGPVVTASGLLFIAATKDEKFRCFSTATGALLWEASLPAAGFATPATYEINGRQYVVIACGGGKLKSKSGDAYVAFALPQGSP